MNPPKDQYPNALEVIRQITNLTRGEDCIYRGESSISFEYPCSSNLYRQLKDEGFPDRDIPELLKERQDELIEKMRPHDDDGKNDMERLMSCQHNDALTNLLDFTESAEIAMYFACWKNDDQDGRVIIKRKNTFGELVVRDDTTLPDNRDIFMKPQKKLGRAKDQEGLLVHSPSGFIQFGDQNTVVIKHEWKQEVLSYLEKIQSISHEKLFYDMRGVIERIKRGYEKQEPHVTQSVPSLQGFAKSEDNKDILNMEQYKELLDKGSKSYIELLRNYADILLTNFTKLIENGSQNAETYYNRAFVYQSKPDPDYERAISDYDNALKLKPDYIKVYNNRGVAHWQKSKPDYERAISDYGNALKLDPDYADAYANRGNAHITKPNPDYTKALSDVKRALESDQKHAGAYNIRGLVYMGKPNPDYNLAILSFNRVLNLNSEYAEAYNNRGLAYMGKPNPDYDKALADYARAIDLKPRLKMPYNNRGLAYMDKPDSDYGQAISNFTRAIELDPHYVGAYNNRGLAYMNKPDPDYELALSDFKKAIKLDSKSSEAHNNCGLVYAQRLDPDYVQALSEFNRSIELNPKSAHAHNNRGRAYVETLAPDYRRAILDFSIALELDPKLTRARHNRALAYMSEHNPDYAQAIQDFTRVIEEDPGFLDAYVIRGDAYIHKPNPDYELAIRDYTHMIKKLRVTPSMDKSKLAEVHKGRGNAYANKPQPDYKKAFEDFNEALKLNPESAGTYFLRAHLYAKLEDCSSARSDYEAMSNINSQLKKQPISPELKKCLESRGKENQL